ncbi:MAG: tetratricopeptide repeat protein [Deltaproteobacteria bacterium]|nr:tetratricopeptide repeat protein [Deltaproteobacteria bacterium]MCL5278227.1 tetratricopeptide repeat protein [Deltaproteobacteria bacterium]
MRLITKAAALRAGAVLLLLAVGTYYGMSCSRDKPDRLYASAINAAAKGNVELAENLYKLIIKHYPNSSVRKDAMYRLGLLEYLYFNDYPIALEQFYDLVYTYPHYRYTFDAYLYIARIYIEQQDMPQKGIEIYEKLLSTTASGKDMKRVLPRLAVEYESVNNIPKATAVYKRLLGLYRKPPPNYLYEYAYLRYLAGSYSDAIKDFQHVHDLYPDSSYSVSAQIAMADCYEETGRSEDALSLLNGLKSAYPTQTSIIDIKIESITNRLKNKKK